MQSRFGHSPDILVSELYSTKLSDFMKTNMEISNAHIYLLEATVYQDENIKSIAKNLCAEMFDILSNSQVCLLSPYLLQLILHDKNLNMMSESLSKKVAMYCRSRVDTMEGSFLVSITDSTFMPNIHPSEALFFLNLCITHKIDSLENVMIDKKPSLRLRCIEASKQWKVAFGDSVLSERVLEVSTNVRSQCGYSNLSNLVKVELLEAALASANKDMVQLSVDKAQLSKNNVELSKKNEELFKNNGELSKKNVVLAALDSTNKEIPNSCYTRWASIECVHVTRYNSNRSRMIHTRWSRRT